VKLASRSLLVVAVALGLCGEAGAEIRIIGAPLDRGVWTSKSCETAGCAFVNEYGRAPTFGVPPIWPHSLGSGVIVRLNVAGATTPGVLRVRTIGYRSRTEETVFKAASAPIAVVPSAGVQTYPLAMPISDGDQVGLSMSPGTSIGFLEGEGFFSRWKSDPPESGFVARDGEGSGLVGFNVEVQPPPSISLIGGSPAARVPGPTTGGTKVIISGINLEGASSVRFGSVPAASFTVISENEVEAISPPSPGPAAMPISITTIAGTATSTQNFEYFIPAVTCTVPALKGKSLKAARRALVAAHCGLGRVTKRGGAKARSGKVVRQNRAPGSESGSGAKVAVTLKPPPSAHKKAAGRLAVRVMRP
jgi:hypothetical protein